MNPSHKSMVPCPYFLDGKCRFAEDECRYCTVLYCMLVRQEDDDTDQLCHTQNISHKPPSLKLKLVTQLVITTRAAKSGQAEMPCFS